jgi:hypothetical protein
MEFILADPLGYLWFGTKYIDGMEYLRMPIGISKTGTSKYNFQKKNLQKP